MRDSVSFLHRVSAWTEKVGMTDDESTLIKMAITITVAILIYIISRKWLSKLLKKVVGKTKSTWDDILYDQGFFRKLASLIPPFTAYIVLTFITWEYKYVLRRLVDIWLIIVTLFIITSLLNAINKIYESYPVSKNRPITFFIQLIKVFLYTVVVITVVSVLVNKSPEHLIVGLSAFAAVLLLIFKDSILGFVAGIQLTSNNMIRIGDEMAQVMTDAGISVVHDRSLYDYPSYSGAYNRSLASIESYLQKYPSISFVLDVHRDAVQDANGQQFKLLCGEDKNAAQLEFVIGSNGGGLSHDLWRENLKLACAVQETLYKDYPTLMRPVTVRNSRYNQHMTTGSLLVEVGTAGNSLEEAVNAARLFAAGFAKTIQNGT